MTSVPLEPADDPLPSLLARFSPACPSGRLWVEQLAFATRSEARVARALEAVRARAGEGGS